MWLILIIFFATMFVLVNKNKNQNNKPKKRDDVFSVPDYLERIEKVNNEILSEVIEDIPIILWWGLDGLRLNEDGTNEWIHKENKANGNCANASVITNKDVQIANVKFTTADRIGSLGSYFGGVMSINGGYK